MQAPRIGSIHAIFNGQKQFLIPVYQRTYSWGKEQREQLWKDIVDMQQNAIRTHFIGSIVDVAEQSSAVGVQEYTIIDGQQRITTLLLLLIALRDYINKNPKKSMETSVKQIEVIYLKNEYVPLEDVYKLVLTQADHESFIAIVEDRANTVDENSRLLQNYKYFLQEIEKETLNVEEIHQSVGKLEFVEITLERDRDMPQQIFESLNSTGMDLSQSDLIRNYVLMGLEPVVQRKVYDLYWNPMENLFQYENQAHLMDDFFRDYITAYEGKIPTKQKVYEAFKEIYNKINAQTVESICKDLYDNAVLYTNMHYGTSKEPDLNQIFKDIKDLRMNVAYPFLLNVYNDYKKETISREEFIQILSLCESYVFRRSILEIPTNSLNKTFATLMSLIDKSNYLSSFKNNLMDFDSYKLFPKNDIFLDAFVSKNIYSMRNRMYLLTKLENYDNKSPIDESRFSIEHILPQNKNLNSKWKEMLGEDWQNIQKEFVHTIGNLTLTAYNSEMSDRSFEEKLETKGGFKESALRINRLVAKSDIWNKHKIRERAEALFDIALDTWKYPHLSEEEQQKTLHLYAEDEESVSFPLPDYTFSQESRQIYDILDQNIMSRLPNIQKVYLKYYISYKLETTVVDVIPQDKGLKVLINLNLENVDDPEHLCRDVSTIGKWGVGDTEIMLNTKDKILYVMGIIEQSYDMQNF